MANYRPPMMELAMSFAISAALLACSPAATPAVELPRVALVVGVATYSNVPLLPNARNDAGAVAAALERMGFAVETVLDPDRGALEQAVRRLGQRSEGAAAALFFYAGHALELSGVNWLLPTSAKLASPQDLRFEGLDLDSVLAQTAGRAEVSLVFLDACRENPFRAKLTTSTREIPTRGLARVETTKGTFVAYASAPGTVAQDGAGSHSPFTEALLHNIEKPGVELRRLLSDVRREVRQATGGRQVPWDTSAIDGDFFFRPAPDRASQQTAQAPEHESLFWDSVRSSSDPTELEAYLKRFPQGVFSVLARARLARLRGPAGKTPSSPVGSSVDATESAAGSQAATTGEAGQASHPEFAAATSTALRTTLTEVVPQLSGARREGIIQRYLSEREHKAQTVSLAPLGAWRTGGWGNAEFAEARALESCQLRYGGPCVLIAVDDQVVPPKQKLEPRDMPRVRYEGQFDAAHIPIIPRSVRKRADVMSYRRARGSKAAAIHPLGSMFLVSGAPNERAAQESVLAKCNGVRDGEEGPCFLYAVGQKVVLPMRLTSPSAQRP